MRPQRLLLIGASHDMAAPVDVCHKPFVKALEKAGAEHLTEVIMETDHLFMTKRIALARLVVAWLRSECGF